MQPAITDPAITYTGQEFRQYVRSQLSMASGVGGEQGVLTANNLTVTQHGAGNLSVDVASGFGYVVGDDVTNQGTYQCWNDGTVNVTGWTVPGSGTFHHRLELQVQDKLNGSYPGYTGNLVPLLDIGGGLRAEDPSCITLATIDIPSGSGSITNAMINDYRQRIGPVSVFKTARTQRTHATSFIDDPDLQLLNLQANSKYALWGNLLYTGGSGGPGPTEGDFTWAWRVSGGTTMFYTAPHVSAGGAVILNTGFAVTDTPTGLTAGGGTLQGIGITGTIITGAAPAFAVLQWAQNSDSANGTAIEAGAWLRVSRLG
jgi:hypothetical protein